MKKKGFTLIELLAVIVVLAIIAVIAVPQILNVIEKSRQGAAESSALGYLNAVENYIVMHEVNSSEYPYDLRGQTLNVASNTSISFLDLFLESVKADNVIPPLNEIIAFKGQKPSSGTITINEKGIVESANLVINEKYNVGCTSSNKCEAVVNGNTTNSSENTNTSNSSNPSCKLKVVEISDMYYVEFDNLDSNIVEYGINKTGTVDYSMSNPQEPISPINMEVGTFYGYVKDTNGNEGRCSITFEKAPYIKTVSTCHYVETIVPGNCESSCNYNVDTGKLECEEPQDCPDEIIQTLELGAPIAEPATTEGSCWSNAIGYCSYEGQTSTDCQYNVNNCQNYFVDDLNNIGYCYTTN